MSSASALRSGSTVSCSAPLKGRAHPSRPKLKTLEAMQLFFDPPLQFLARAFGGGTDPIPFLQQQFPLLTIGLEIERGDNLISDQNRQREIAEAPFLLRQIVLKKMLIAEDQMRPFALDDQ